MGKRVGGEGNNSRDVQFHLSEIRRGDAERSLVRSTRGSPTEKNLELDRQGRNRNIIVIRLFGEYKGLTGVEDRHSKVIPAYQER